ncbi:MAG TPA: IS481 family transposase, partial [bacterium]
MNSHQNARTTPHLRRLMVTRVLEQGYAPARVAEELGISVRTVYKWLARYGAEGQSGLANRSSAPHRIPHRLGESWQQQIEHLRRAFRMTIRQIAERLALARSTVALVLKRLGLNRLKLLEPKEPKEPIRRFEKARPGELLHLDIKKLGRIGRVGHRITGDRRSRARGIGWEFVHVCIDDHSRLAYVEVLPNERAESACGFLKRAIAWFKVQGVRVRGIMTDNGSCYVSRAFAALCGRLRLRLRLRHVRTRPYTPKTNGKAERFIQTLLREWAYGRAYANSTQRQAQLPR